jgi:hypothetical protein
LVEEANNVLDKETPETGESVALTAITDESAPESEDTLVKESILQPKPVSVEEPEIVSITTHDTEAPIVGTCGPR